MKLSKIFEDTKGKSGDDLFREIIAIINKETRKMSDDETYKFHERLKTWCNKLI